MERLLAAHDALAAAHDALAKIKDTAQDSKHASNARLTAAIMTIRALEEQIALPDAKKYTTDLIEAAYRIIGGFRTSYEIMKLAGADARIWLGPLESTIRTHAESGNMTALVDAICIVGPVLDAHGTGDGSRLAKSCIVTIRKSLTLVKESGRLRDSIVVQAAHLISVCMKHSSHEFALANLLPLIFDDLYKMSHQIMGPLISAVSTNACPVMGRVYKDMRDVSSFTAAISSRKDGGEMLESFIKRKTAAARAALLPALYSKIGRVGCHNLKCSIVSCASEDALPMYTCPVAGCNTSFCSRVCMFMDVRHSVACLGMDDYTDTMPQ
jgi:hypothetical protein